MIKLLHTADIHLNEAPNLLEKTALENISNIAIKNKVNYLLIAGDLFDQNKPEPKTINFVLKILNRLKSHFVDTLIVPGDHDYYEKNSVWESKIKDVAYVFTQSNVDFLEYKNAIFYGCAITSPEKNTVPLFDNYPLKKSKDKLTIGIAHGLIDPLIIEEIQSGKSIAGKEFDYISLGHFHDFTEVLSKPSCFYSGSPVKGNTYLSNTPSVILIDISGKCKKIKRINL